MQNIFSSQNRALSFILLTTFLTFLGFSIVIPILPFLVEKYLHNPSTEQIALNVGLLMSSYAFCQFLAAPGLGLLSDKYGRRPILLISLFGTVIGYLVMGFAGAIWMLLLGRVIDGLTGGNISTIYAYIADISKKEDRGKYFGLLGAAGGVGFMLGPAIGGLSSTIFLTAPLFLAAGIAALNMVWGYFVLPESLKQEHRIVHFDFKHLNPFAQFSHVFSVSALRWLFFIGFMFFLGLVGMQAISSVFLKDVLSWNPSQIGFLLFVVGLIDIFAQGFLVNKLLPILGDYKTSFLGFFLTFVGFCVASMVVFFPSLILIYVGVIILITGDGLVEPSFSGLVSNAVGAQKQGRIHGANQSMQSVTRVIAPLYAAYIYGIGKNLPYASAAVFMIICMVGLVLSLPALRAHKTEP